MCDFVSMSMATKAIELKYKKTLKFIILTKVGFSIFKYLPTGICFRYYEILIHALSSHFHQLIKIYTLIKDILPN